MFIYSLIYTLLLPILIIRTILKDSGSLMQKLGFGYKQHNQPIHLHCVSVGEFNASISLIDKLLIDNEIVITTTTKTGASACKNHYGNKVSHYYLPFDLPLFVNNFFTKINPKVSIILETEIWPTFITIAKQRGVKTFLINARLSDKSLKKYQKYQNFALKIINNFEIVATQDKFNDDNFKKLGVKNSKIFGNLKFDILAKTNSQKLSKIQDTINTRKIIVCASTHFNEEELLIKAYQKNPCKQLLVIVPRHPQRFIEVEKTLKNYKINYKKQSDNIACNENTQILLADSMGFVLEFYSLCELAFIGGSLVKTGGHNMLEAIAFKKLVVFGKHTFNFTNISQMLLKNQAAVQIENADEFFKIIEGKNNHALTIENANNLLIKNQGTSEKIVKLIKEY